MVVVVNAGAVTGVWLGKGGEVGLTGGLVVIPTDLGSTVWPPPIQLAPSTARSPLRFSVGGFLAVRRELLQVRAEA
jgi:hypothetical protein